MLNSSAELILHTAAIIIIVSISAKTYYRVGNILYK